MLFPMMAVQRFYSNGITSLPWSAVGEQLLASLGESRADRPVWTYAPSVLQCPHSSH